MKKYYSAIEKKLLVIFLFSFLCYPGTNGYAKSQKNSFTGVWKGDGSVKVDGVPKNATCRVRNTLKSGTEYYSVISCTVADLGRGKATIVVDKVGSARYSGTLKDAYSEEKAHLSARQTGNELKVNVRSRRLKGDITLMKMN